MNSYRDLLAWQKAFDLGMRVYEFAGQLPESERAGRIALIRPLAYQIPGTTADGCGPQNPSEYIRHLRGARGDLYQLDTQTLFAVKRGYIAEDVHLALARQRTSASPCRVDC